MNAGDQAQHRPDADVESALTALRNARTEFEKVRAVKQLGKIGESARLAVREIMQVAETLVKSESPLSLTQEHTLLISIEALRRIGSEEALPFIIQVQQQSEKSNDDLVGLVAALAHTRLTRNAEALLPFVLSSWKKGGKQREWLLEGLLELSRNLPEDQMEVIRRSLSETSSAE